MADIITKLENVINPQVMADIVSYELEKQLRATKFYKVNRTLTGRAGDTITVPSWKYIGMAEDVAENERVPQRQLTAEDVSYTVKKAAVEVPFTDETALSAHGDTVGELTRQLRVSIYEKMEDDGIQLLEAITPDIGNVFNSTATGADAFYDDLVDALGMLKYNEDQGINTFLFTNNNTVKKLRKSDFFLDFFTMGEQIVQTGVIGRIAGCSVIISNRLTNTRSYILMPECLTAFMKRDINIETEREMSFKRTKIGSDCHYVIAIEDFDKIVAVNHPQFA